MCLQVWEQQGKPAFKNLALSDFPKVTWEVCRKPRELTFSDFQASDFTTSSWFLSNSHKKQKGPWLLRLYLKQQSHVKCKEFNLPLFRSKTHISICKLSKSESSVYIQRVYIGSYNIICTQTISWLKPRFNESINNTTKFILKNTSKNRVFVPT